MPTITFYSSDSDGRIREYNADYDLARNAATGTPADDEIILNVGQELCVADYRFFRGFVFFDTSPLPNDAAIASAILSLYGYSPDYSDIDFDVVVQSGMATYPHDPLVEGDYDRTHYSGDGGSFNTVDYASAAYNNITLNADGRSWINKDGWTKFALRSSRDISGTPPGELVTEWVYLRTYESGVGYRPKLVVTGTWAVVIPTVTTQAVTDIEPTTATGHGTITDLGAEDCDKRGICWNTSGNPTVADDKSEETDSFGTGAFSCSMTGLLPSTHYYVRAYAHNSAGYGYGSQVEFDAPSGIDTDDSGEGYWSKSGDQFDAGEQTYEFTDNKTISLYGEGEAAANIDRGMGGLAQAAMALLT